MSEYIDPKVEEFVDAQVGEQEFLEKDPTKMPVPTTENPIIALHKTEYGKLHNIKEEKYLVKCGHSFTKKIKHQTPYRAINHDCAKGITESLNAFLKRLKDEANDELDKKNRSIVQHLSMYVPLRAFNYAWKARFGRMERWLHES